MKPQVCPNCEHEIFDDNDQCPFCGAALPRRSIFSSSSGPAAGTHVRKIILAGLVALLMIGATSTFMLMGRADKARAQEGYDQRDYMHTAAEECRENMHSILSAEDDYLAEYGRYAEDFEELEEYDPSLVLLCPENGEHYNLSVSKQGVQLNCPVHGAI